jgi:phosphoenolpyruvate carboxylase
LEDLRENDPAAFAALKAALPQSNFLGYTLTNVETNLASANLELMGRYGELVTDPALRETFMGLIVSEFHRTRDLLADLFDGDMASRRPRMAKTLGIREAPLRVLHLQQIALLREWRSLLARDHQTEAEALFPRLLLSINAISSGLRTTG